MFSQIRSTVGKYDVFLVMLSTIVIALGVLFIWSATQTFGSSVRYLVVQSVSIILGGGLMYLITLFDYEYLAEQWGVIVFLCIGLLLLVLAFGIGQSSTGTKGWIRLGPIGIQPAEIAKIGFIITMSKHLSSIKGDINYLRNIVLLVAHLMVPVLLVLLQPDWGTAMVFGFIFLVMIFVAGIHLRYLAIATATIAGFGLFAWKFLFTNIQKNRFFAFLNPEGAPGGYGYHVMQSKLAIGSGQITGKGLLRGIQTQMGALPEKHTDFIFAVIGEEGGFILSVLVVLLLFVLIGRCIFIGINARSAIGSFLCFGVAAMWLFHVFENIGMTIGLTPVTGIPLPFISYGGSSLMTNLMALGIVQSVYSRRRVKSF